MILFVRSNARPVGRDTKLYVGAGTPVAGGTVIGAISSPRMNVISGRPALGNSGAARDAAAWTCHGIVQVSLPWELRAVIVIVPDPAVRGVPVILRVLELNDTPDGRPEAV